MHMHRSWATAAARNFTLAWASTSIAQAHPGFAGLPGATCNLSLVAVGCTSELAHGTSVQVVSWWLPGRAGRFVRLDEQDRVKFIVPVGEYREPQDLRDGTVVIVHDLGIRMVKPRGRDLSVRPTMPRDAMALRTMWHLVQASYSSSLLATSLVCDGDSDAFGIASCVVCGDGDTDLQCALLVTLAQTLQFCLRRSSCSSVISGTPSPVVVVSTH